MSAKQVKIIDKTRLFIKWKDESESRIDLKYLRDECPCANCKGETVLLKTYKPARPASGHPDMYKVKDIEPVGGYAIQITWKDGHNTGIYSWDFLKKLDIDQESGNKQDYDSLI